MGNKQLDSKEIKAYMGEDAVFKGVLTFSGTVRVDARPEGGSVFTIVLPVAQSGADAEATDVEASTPKRALQRTTRSPDLIVCGAPATLATEPRMGRR